MTRDEFLKEFAGIANQFKWYWAAGVIRCNSPTSGLMMCPITAYRSTLKDGREYMSSDYRRAAKDIGLIQQAADVIACAADKDWQDSFPIEKEVRGMLFSIVSKKKV